MGRRKKKKGKSQLLIPVSLVDKFDFAEMEADNLAQALRCAKTAVYSDYDDDDSYIRGTLSILTMAASQLHSKVKEGACDATRLLYADETCDSLYEDTRR